MKSVHKIFTHDNMASSSRAKEYISIVIVNNDGRPIDGQIVLSDGTIARFRNGLRPKGLEFCLK